MKLGVNSVLFGGHDMETAFKYAQLCGYDGIELSAIDGMSEHLVLDRWKDIAPRAKELSKQYTLSILAMEQPSQDPVKMEQAFQAAADIRVLHQSGYAGPLDLEIIGAKAYDLPRCVAIAAEARGHMQACLQACGAR